MGFSLFGIEGSTMCGDVSKQSQDIGLLSSFSMTLREFERMPREVAGMLQVAGHQRGLAQRSNFCGLGSFPFHRAILRQRLFEQCQRLSDLSSQGICNAQP